MNQELVQKLRELLSAIDGLEGCRADLDMLPTEPSEALSEVFNKRDECYSLLMKRPGI